MPQRHDDLRRRPARRRPEPSRNSLVLYDPEFAQPQRREAPPPRPHDRPPHTHHADARRRTPWRPELSRNNSSLVVYDPDFAQPEGRDRPPPPPPRGEGVEIRRAELRTAYKVLPTVIGTGAFGKVRQCIHRERRLKLAVKSVPLRGHAGNAVLLRNEISILTRLRHRHIVCVADVVQDAEFIHIVMEQCKGGDLFDLTHATRLGEGRIRGIVACLVDAVAYLHDKHIVHRDLKSDHLMFSKKDINSDIKIIDFGVATIHAPHSPPMTAFAGSLRSVAPEVIQRSYDNACDLWSVGIITYFLLTQTMPFDGQDQKDIFQRIVSGVYRFPPWAGTGLSEEAKSFVDCLLQVDVRRRMSARVALKHPWLRGAQGRQVAPERQAAPARHDAARPAPSHARRPRRQPGY